MSNAHIHPAFDLDGLLQDLMAANDANARAYRERMKTIMPQTPTDTDETPEDGRWWPVRQEGEGS